MGTLLEIWNFSSLNPEEIEKLNKLVTGSDITFLIKIEGKQTSQQTEVQDQVTSQGNSTKHSKRANTYSSQVIPEN